MRVLQFWYAHRSELVLLVGQHLLLVVTSTLIAIAIGVPLAIAAAIGAGGLGEYIYRGLSMVDSTVILAGAIPAAALALVVDGVLLWVERQLSAHRHRGSRRLAQSA